MLTLAGFAFVSFILAILTLVVFEQEPLWKAIFFSFCFWGAIYAMFRIGCWLYGKRENGYANPVSWNQACNSKHNRLPSVGQASSRQANSRSRGEENAAESVPFKVPLSMRASFSPADKNTPADAREAERLRCARQLGPLRDRTDALSLKQVVEFIDHKDFEVKAMALEIASYRYMGDEKPGRKETIAKIQKLYEQLIVDYDAGKVADDEVKEVGEGCLLALFRIGGWEPSMLEKKQHIAPLRDYMAEFMPKENPYEDYQPMTDPEGALAANPPVDWLQKRDFQQLRLAAVEHAGVKYEVVMLINRKKGVMAITLNGQLCKVTTRLAHTDSCNSGDRKYTCLRPESVVILPGRMLNLSDEELSRPALEYNDNRECWETNWSQMESGEVYNTVVYDHHSCYISLKPAELKAEFTIFTTVDSTT